MKRITHHKAAKQNTIVVVTSGLTSDEIEQINALVKRLERKRIHEKRPRILYDLTFNV